jgi:hypothetical protein
MVFKMMSHISIDIETKNLTNEQVDFESKFLKAHPSTKDEAKKQAQIETKKRELSTRGALTNSCEIASIAIHSDRGRAVVFHTLDEVDLTDYNMNGCKYDTEREMLSAFSSLLDECCDDETEIVVANGKGFDFPKIRLACVRNRVQLPEVLMPGAVNKIYDVTYIACKYFFVGNQMFMSLDELCTRLGVRTGEKAVSGAEVPAMIERGEHTEVLVYNGLDAIKTTECYLLMTGRYQ